MKLFVEWVHPEVLGTFVLVKLLTAAVKELKYAEILRKIEK